jgi:hypothetical protein
LGLEVAEMLGQVTQVDTVCEDARRRVDDAAHVERRRRLFGRAFGRSGKTLSGGAVERYRGGPWGLREIGRRGRGEDGLRRRGRAGL